MSRSTATNARGLLIGAIWISPWTIGFAAFMLLPISLSLYYSLTDYTLLSPPEWIGFDNYRALLSDSVFWKAVGNTAIYAAIWIPMQACLALVIAAALVRPGRLVALYRTAIFLPSLVPIVATSLIWLWLFRREDSPLNAPFAAIPGLDQPPWIGQETWAMASMIFVGLWAVGQPVVIFMVAMQGVPKSLYEAATVDGMGRVRTFMNITLPMISPLILFNVITSIIAAWQVFAHPFLITQGEPNRATYFYTMYLYDKAFQFGQMGYASAMAWVQLLIILALTGVVLLASRRLVHERAA